MSTVTVDVIAFMRSKDRIGCFLDTPFGWTLLDKVSRVPREVFAQMIDEADLDETPGHGAVVLRLADTNFPECLPEGKLFGVHKSFTDDPDIPKWTGPMTKEEESQATIDFIEEVERSLGITH